MLIRVATTNIGYYHRLRFISVYLFNKGNPMSHMMRWPNYIDFSAPTIYIQKLC